MIWVLCVVFGIATVSFIPGILAAAVAFLSSIGKRYPKFADIGSGIAMFIVGCAFIVEVVVFAAVYHHLFLGVP